MHDIDAPQRGVLIVDDSIPDAGNLKVIVQHLGYRVCGIAPSGMSALDIMGLTGCETSLVLLNLDLKAPLSGYETARRISSQYPVRFILLTSLEKPVISDPDDLHMRPYVIVRKPFSIGLVEAAIRDAFESTMDEETEPAVASFDRDRRLAPRIKALDYPFEYACIDVDERPVKVVLKDISMSGLGIMSDDSLKKEKEYPTKISLSQPGESIQAVSSVRSIYVRQGMMFLGLRVVPEESDRKAWQEYIRYRERIRF